MTFTASKKELLGQIESQIQTLVSSEKITSKLPPGVSLRVQVFLLYGDNCRLEGNTRPETVGEVFNQLSFFHCGYQMSEWRRISAAIQLEKNSGRNVLEFLRNTTEKELLRTPGWSKNSLAALYEVLHWHGYTETFQ